MPEITLDTDDLVTIADFAREQELSRKTVRSWTIRYADFPAPVIRTPTTALWSRAAIKAWLEEEG